MRSKFFILTGVLTLIIRISQSSLWALDRRLFFRDRFFPNPTPSPSLIDSNGASVGEVLSVEGLGSVINQQVAVLVERNTVRFALVATRIQLIGTIPLLFESSDCSGPPLILQDAFIQATEMFPAVALAGVDLSQLGQVVYGPDPGENPVISPIQSWIVRGEPCAPFTGEPTAGVVNARVVADLSDLQLPFEVQLNGE